MDKKLIHNFLTQLKQLEKENVLSKKYHDIILEFYQDYKNAVGEDIFNKNNCDNIFLTFLNETKKQLEEPYQFELYHKKIVSPINYEKFGNDFVRPLIDIKHSKIFGTENLKKIQEQLSNNENVILLANHQTELDPQAIKILLDKDFRSIIEEMIFVAGERVITDPLAIPFSMGCNLLCIYSKKHINNIPSLKQQKLLHNRKTMNVMSSLLQEGRKIIYIAPSGGRDRLSSQGKVSPALFDPQSIEMMNLMSKKAKTPTHFYPLALYTYHILPPPEVVEKEIGEKRKTKKYPAYLAFGKKLDMNKFSDEEKKQKRIKTAEFIWKEVVHEYNKIHKE